MLHSARHEKNTKIKRTGTPKMYSISLPLLKTYNSVHTNDTELHPSAYKCHVLLLCLHPDT